MKSLKMLYGLIWTELLPSRSFAGDNATEYYDGDRLVSDIFEVTTKMEKRQASIV